ncbi:MAG: ribosome small subunit-dependent GTPase A [Clostridiales bacterium]|nr:ribosome small subunit-dependent GTPase A [Clostridiales bacterium]
MQDNGTIIKAVSGQYIVQTGTNTVVCKARGRFRFEQVVPLVGDRVVISTAEDGTGVIQEILPRKNAFVRPPVANLDQLVIIASNVIPVTSPYLIDRMTAIAALNDADCVIVLNKCDLDRADALYEIYTTAGFRTIRTSAVTGEGIEELRAALAPPSESGEMRISVFTGNSGVGKSSILNCLSPEFHIATGEVSRKLGRGRHTTRHVELFRLSDGVFIADTPGFSSFDTGEMNLFDKTQLQHLFREFKPYLGRCRFTNCAHLKEIGCAVLEAVRNGEIHPVRHESYARLYEQTAQIKPWEK